MKERELVFDRKKHMLYSKKAKNIIQKYLFNAYGKEEAERLWEKTQRIYVNFLKDMPFLGGKKNSQAGSVYDCVALFAYYEAVPDKPSIEEFEEMNNELFVPQMETGGLINTNWAWVMKVQWLVFKWIEKSIIKHQDEWVGNYHMKVYPYDKKKGVQYEFTTCPIADFAKRHGYMHLMPAMCNPDYPMLKGMRAGLIRKSTCANGACCDYWIVGDKSEQLKKHPIKKDDNGYLYNE